MDDKIKKAIHMNQIFLGNNRGAAQLFKASTPTIGNLIATGPIQNIKCLEPLPVFLDEVEVKAETDLVYMHKDDTMVIRITFGEDVKIDEEGEYYVRPNIRTMRIGCPTCQNYFSIGQAPCECIRNAPQIYVDDVLVESIDIFNGDTPQERFDYRQKLIRDFFGGAISKLTILDLI